MRRGLRVETVQEALQEGPWASVVQHATHGSSLMQPLMQQPHAASPDVVSHAAAQDVVTLLTSEAKQILL